MGRKILNDYFTVEQWTGSAGIFHYLQTLDVPWADDNIADNLDLLYHGNRSGQKIISPLLDVLPATNQNKTYIANCLVTRFGEKWEKCWETLKNQYSLHDDMNIIESEELDRTDTGTHSRTETDSDTGTVTDAGTESGTTTNTGTVTTTGSAETDTTESGTSGTTTDNETTTTNSTTGNSGAYGFNSAVSVPTDTQTGSGTGSEILDGETHTTTSTTENVDSTSTSETENDLTLTESRTSGNTKTNNLTHSENESGTTGGTRSEEITRTRSGLTGKRTPVELMGQALTFWQYDFFNMVFADIDKVLTIMVY